ncbi:MAG: hypothetical protein AAGI52_17840 [Bacteroidota bacterium]
MPLAPSPPPGFRAHSYRRSWRVPQSREAVWAWLNDPATFTEGQVPPFRVEFVGPDGSAGGFREGVFTAHHGPGMLFAGVLGEQTDPAPGRTAYRDLRYTYGSYALSLRLARPTRLQFWADAIGDDATEVRVQLDADVTTAFVPVWAGAMRVFWGGFGRALDEQVGARLEGALPERWRLRPTLVLAGAALGVGLKLGLRR